MIWLEAWGALVNLDHVEAFAVRAVLDTDQVMPDGQPPRLIAWCLGVWLTGGERTWQSLVEHADEATVLRVYGRLVDQLASLGENVTVVFLNRLLRNLDLDPETVMPDSVRKARVKPSNPSPEEIPA